MEQEMILISRCECERLLRTLTKAEHYCANARSIYDPTVTEDDEPTTTYPGASGFAGATMRDVIQSIESHLM